MLDELCNHPSGGAYEQFIVAAVLQALVELSQVPGVRVETKQINASDASSKVAGDVQVKTGGLTLEALEVTANDWSFKAADAASVVRAHDLGRIHVVARAAREDRQRMMTVLQALDEDVSVLDLAAFRDVGIAFLRKEQRASALKRLYELLDRKQPRTGVVNHYVDLLIERGVAESNS